MSKSVDYQTIVNACDPDYVRSFRLWLDAVLPELPKVVIESTPYPKGFVPTVYQRWVIDALANSKEVPRLVLVKSRNPGWSTEVARLINAAQKGNQTVVDKAVLSTLRWDSGGGIVEIGRVYSVTVYDCCVEGEFEGVLTEIICGEEYFRHLKFDILGVTVEFKEKGNNALELTSV